MPSWASFVAPATDAEELAIASGETEVSFERTRGLYVGTGGDLVVEVGNVQVTFVGVPAGTVLPVAATKLYGSSTADDVVALR